MEASRPARRLTWRDVASLLASTLGWDKSEEVTLATARKLSFNPDDLGVEEAMAILVDLGDAPGIVGITARFARSRARFSGPPPADQRAARQTTAPSPDPVPAAAKRIAYAEVCTMFSHCLGQEKSEEVVHASARKLHLPANQLTQAEALVLFEELASHGGIVGVTARFAKARLALRFKS